MTAEMYMTPNVHELKIEQKFGTRVLLSPGEVFYVDGMNPDRVKNLFQTRHWYRWPSGRIVQLAHIVELMYGPIPSTAIPEVLEN